MSDCVSFSPSNRIRSLRLALHPPFIRSAVDQRPQRLVSAPPTGARTALQEHERHLNRDSALDGGATAR